MTHTQLLTTAHVDAILADAAYIDEHRELTHAQLAASLRRIAAQMMIDVTDIPDHPLVP